MDARAALGRTHIHTAWDRDLEPRLEVDPGAVVEFEIVDASNGQVTPSSTGADLTTLDFSSVNPVTGPVFVRGAEPGDCLAIDILDVRTSEWGWTGIIPGFGLLTDDFPDPWLRISEIDAARGRVDFAPGAALPLLPFPGTIGVAMPEAGQHSMVPPSRWGGNLDTRHLTRGARLLLPVGVEGALFSVGDTHAAMGDGEVCGTAVEVGGHVALRLELVKGAAPAAPQFILPRPAEPAPPVGYHVCTGVEPDLYEAARVAARQGVEVLVDRGRTPEEAYALLSVAADLRIHEIVDAPNWVVGLFIPDDVLNP